MKIRIGFVSNSSSCSFIICNITNEEKTLVDFVKENPQLIDDFKKRYDWNADNTNFTQEKLIQSAQENNITFNPNENVFCVFGDEDGTLIGEVFDYILRDGGYSDSFKWSFDEMLR